MELCFMKQFKKLSFSVSYKEEMLETNGFSKDLEI